MKKPRYVVRRIMVTDQETGQVSDGWYCLDLTWAEANPKTYKTRREARDAAREMNRDIHD